MKRNKNYNRVMSRVISSSRPSLKSNYSVTRHDVRSSQSVGAKPDVSKVSSSGLSELPIILNDYVPELAVEKSKLRSNVRKPRKTLISLDPALSPARPAVNLQKYASNRPTHSAPNVAKNKHYEPVLPGKKSDSIRSHRRLKDLQDEIRVYEEKEKLLKLQKRLHTTCGIALDADGKPAENKAVQVAVTGTEPYELRYDIY